MKSVLGEEDFLYEKVDGFNFNGAWVSLAPGFDNLNSNGINYEISGYYGTQGQLEYCFEVGQSSWSNLYPVRE